MVAAATANQGKACMSDSAPVFRVGDKVARDVTAANQGNVCLGDMAPAFTTSRTPVLVNDVTSAGIRRACQ